MSAYLVVRADPDEEELARKRDELIELQAELADRELLLASLRAELAAFQERYLREVGALYAELDDVRLKIPEWPWNQDSPDPYAYDGWNAKIAELAEEEQKGKQFPFSSANGHAGERGVMLDNDPEADPSPSLDLKRLYREVAKRVHPDLATNDPDRRKRDLLMQQANAAYQRGDREALRRILEEYESSPESVQGQGVDADWARVTRQIRQIGTRLSEIDREVSRLMSSAIGRLKVKADAAMAEGRDLLAEMAEDLKRRIQMERQKAELRSDTGEIR